MERARTLVAPVVSRPSVAMLLGGFDPPHRSFDIAAGQRPSNDVEELERELDAVVYDFGWLESGRSRSRRLLTACARRTGLWSGALAVAATRRMRSFEVVYVSGEDVAVFACALARLWPGPTPRFVVRVERPLYGRTRVRRWLHHRAMRFALARVELAVCRTAGVAEHLRRELRVPADRVTTFGQEIDTDFFDPRSPRRDAPLDVVATVASRAGAGGVRRYVLTAGLERRDYATLLDAVDGLDAAVVVAAGSPWSKDAFDVERELPANVVVGAFDPVGMRELYRDAAAVVLAVHPTRRACGMNVVGEAWAMARPVVATASGGLCEYVVHGATGVVVPPGDAPALRAAIERVLADGADASRLGEAGRREVVSRLSLPAFVRVVGAAVAPTERENDKDLPRDCHGNVIWPRVTATCRAGPRDSRGFDPEEGT